MSISQSNDRVCDVYSDVVSAVRVSMRIGSEMRKGRQQVSQAAMGICSAVFQCQSQSEFKR